MANKHVLEANSSMAMLRSSVVKSLRNNDDTFGLQLEILTVTAPMRDGSRDGFQVRDLSCMKPGLLYIPGQAIPYGRSAYDGASDHAVQCAYWKKAFAVPLGRAKARMFLNYGLVHTSANAQNFIVGFAGGGTLRAAHFVARDLGDTSWHDDYIRDFLFKFPAGHEVFNGFEKERTSAIRHLLNETSSGQYPAPYIVRLASNSVLTHGFATKLGWSRSYVDRLKRAFAGAWPAVIQQG